MDNVSIISSPCSGCGACAATCPAHAIKMTLDEDGFYIATVDEKLCTECKKCKAVCLKNGAKDATSLNSGILISAKSKNADVISSSSSGGVAYELGRWAVHNGIPVLGVVYDYETNRARSQISVNETDIQKMQGSKYLQSITEEAIKGIIPFLKRSKDNKILVFGTPCQAYGFARILEQNKIREQALIVDFFCHGVPSYKVWERYLSDISAITGSGKLKRVSFRDKKIGWHNFIMSIEGSDGKYQQNSEGDWFYRMYFDNILLSKACFECPVRRLVSKADIRLGDCWGKKYQNREDGISVVLCLTDAGKNMLDRITNIENLEILNRDEIFNAQSMTVYKDLQIRERAFAYFKTNGDLKKTIQHYRKEFNYKRRVKLFAKESTSVLPDGFRALLRNIYRKM